MVVRVFILSLFFLWSACSTVIRSQIILGPEADKLINKSFEPKNEGWQNNGSMSINTTQTYLSNWAAGGNSAFNISGMLTHTLTFRKGKNSWDTYTNLAYGRSVIGLNEASIKTDDKIDITSKYGYRASDFWNYSVMFNTKTQFAPGYALNSYGRPDLVKGKISDLLAPAYLTAALGMDGQKERKFTLFLSPVTFKATVVKNQKLADAGQFGVKPAQYDADGNLLAHGETMRMEFGAYLRMGFSKSWQEKYRLDSKLELFSSYLHNPQNIDFNLESIFAAKFNKYWGCSVIMQAIYDDDIILVKKPASINENGVTIPEIKGPGLQFKQVMAIGFQYSL